MYLDAEDVIQYIGKCAATALPSAKEGHPAFKCEEALGWKGMRALWVMISKSQTRLFILADDTRELVLASKFISTAATPLKSIQEIKITVHLEGCCYIMKCPTHWYLRDVLVALRTEHRHVASVLPGILCGNWQVQERDSPLAASLNDVVGSLREQELNIVCKNKSSANIHRLRTCILRGFPFEYCREDIVELIRSIGISDAKDIIVGKNGTATSMDTSRSVCLARLILRRRKNAYRAFWLKIDTSRSCRRTIASRLTRAMRSNG